jgi:hypothetical protein
MTDFKLSEPDDKNSLFFFLRLDDASCCELVTIVTPPPPPHLLKSINIREAIDPSQRLSITLLFGGGKYF